MTVATLHHQPARLPLALTPSHVRLIAIISLGLIWQFLPSPLIDMVLSRPADVAHRLVFWLSNGLLVRESAATLSAVTSGLLLGGVAGSVAGLVCGFWRGLGRLVQPWLMGLFALPKSAFIPLFILWFGISSRQHTLFVATVVFFFFFFALYAGARDVPAEWRDQLAIWGAGRRQALFALYLPASFGWLLSALRVAVPHAFVAAISVEVIASRDGLGHLVKASSAVLDSTGTVAAIVWLVVLSTTLGVATIAVAERSRWSQKSLTSGA